MKQTTDKSQVDIIPDEVREKINEVFDGTNMGKHKIEAAKFGYSLGIAGRSKTHDEKEQRIKELEKQHEELLPLYQLQANVIQTRNERVKELEEALRKIKVHFGNGESRNPYIKPVIDEINNLLNK